MRFLILGLLVAFATLGSPHVASADSPPAAGDGLMAPDLDAPPPATADTPSTTPPAPDPVEDPSAYASAVSDAVKAGKWLVLAGLLLVGLIAFLRHVVFHKVDWFMTKRGGLVLAAGTSFLVTLGTALAAGQAFNWQLLAAALAVGAGAIGLFHGGKDAAAKPATQPPPVPLRSR